MPIAHPNAQAEEDPIVALLARLYAALTLRADRFDRAREELRARIAAAEAEIEAAGAEAAALDEDTAEVERECARLRRVLRKRERAEQRSASSDRRRRADQCPNPHKPHPKLSNPLWGL